MIQVQMKLPSLTGINAAIFAVADAKVPSAADEALTDALDAYNDSIGGYACS